MSPEELISSIYLGDRSCKGILLYTLPSRVELWIDCISRIRDPSGNWNFYTEEDLVDGRIVFTGVEGFSMEPTGWVPNDFIESLRLVRRLESGLSEFEFVVGAVDCEKKSELVKIRIFARVIELVEGPPVDRPSNSEDKPKTSGFDS